MKMIYYPGCRFFNINDEYEYSNLTIGKKYECVEFNTAQGSYYLITNNRGKICRYSKDWFMTIEEYRNKRLEELGI